MILVSIIQYSCMSAAFEEQRKHNCSCKAHKVVLGRRNLRNDGVDCYRAVMAMSKQGYDCEWRGVSVFCVCVFVVRHRLCISLSVCLNVGGYTRVTAQWYVWIACVRVCVGHSSPKNEKVRCSFF